MEDVERAAARRPLHLQFPKVVEAKFEHDTSAQRCRHIVIFVLIATIPYGVGPLRDLRMVPDVFTQALAMKIAVVALFLGFVAWCFFRRPPPFLRELFIPVCCLAALVATLIPAVMSDSPLAAHVHYSGIFAVLYGNLIVRARFPFACLTSVLLPLAYIVTLPYIDSLPAYPMISADVVMLFVAVTSLSANYKLERDERSAYLMRLRGEISSTNLTRMNRELDRISQIDALTGIANRGAFDRRVRSMWAEASPGGRSVCILMLDVDWFKGFNDLYGHQAGDSCLREVAALVQAQMRNSADLIARYGGEEFAVLLGDADFLDGVRVAERMRLAVEEGAIRHEDAPGKIITVSIGVAASPATVELSAFDLIEAADAALYAAKRNGRNRVWPPILSTGRQPEANAAIRA